MLTRAPPLQFQVVEINGEAVQGAMRDTLLMPGGDCNVSHF